MDDQRMAELTRDLGDAEVAGLLLLARPDLVELPARAAHRHLEAIFTLADAMADERAVPARRPSVVGAMPATRAAPARRPSVVGAVPATRTAPARRPSVPLIWATRLAATAAGLAVVLTGGLAVTGSLPASAQEFLADSAARIGITLPSPALDARQVGANDAPGTGPATPPSEPSRSGDAPRGSDDASRGSEGAPRGSEGAPGRSGDQRPDHDEGAPGERRGHTDDDQTGPRSEREPVPPPGGEPADLPVTGDPDGDDAPGDVSEVEGTDGPAGSEEPRGQRDTAPGRTATTPSGPKTSAAPTHDDPAAADGATDAPAVMTGSAGTDLDTAAADGVDASASEDGS